MYLRITLLCVPKWGSVTILSSSRDCDRASYWALQVGNQSHTDYRSPLFNRTVDDSRRKTILSLVIYRRVGILFTPYPLRRSGEELWRRWFDSTTLLTQFFLESRGYCWNGCDIGVTWLCSWCLLTVWIWPGELSSKGFCHTRYRFGSGIPEDADIETLLYFLWWQIVPWLFPSTGGDSSDDPLRLVSLCFRRSEVDEFVKFLSHVLRVADAVAAD